MMNTYGPLYTGTLKYYHNRFFPILEVGTTQETEFPFRKGKCLVFRAPFTKPAAYIGLLRKTIKHPEELSEEDIDEIMVSAFNGRIMGYGSIDNV
jgi:hypothetical protein